MKKFSCFEIYDKRLEQLGGELTIDFEIGTILYFENYWTCMDEGDDIIAPDGPYKVRSIAYTLVNQNQDIDKRYFLDPMFAWNEKGYDSPL